MTYTEDVIEEQEAGGGSEYPTAFGITFTPQVQGILIGFLGLIGAVYVGMTFVKPAWEEVSTLKTTLQEKEAEKNGLQQVDPQAIQKAENQLKETEALQEQILSLFANDNTSTSLLIDLNRVILNQAKLTSFAPEEIKEPIIRDGSFGADLDGKVKLQSFNLEIEGSFEKTQTVIRNLERYQPLVLIKNVAVEPSGRRYIRIEPGKSTPVIPDLRTTLTVDFVVPRNPEELKVEEEAAAKAEAEAAAKDQKNKPKGKEEKK